jgi:hypothetical protein
MSQQSFQDARQRADGYSSTVQLFLHINEATYELADVGPFDATLRNPKVLLAGADNAILEIIVDGRSEQHPKKVTSSNAQNRIRFLS